MRPGLVQGSSVKRSSRCPARARFSNRVSHRLHHVIVTGSAFYGEVPPRQAAPDVAREGVSRRGAGEVIASFLLWRTS